MKTFWSFLLVLFTIAGLLIGIGNLSLIDFSSAGHHSGGAINAMMLFVGIGGIAIAAICSLGVWLISKSDNKKDN